MVDKTTSDPPRLKELYDIENSPACRKVREMITELDLVVGLVIPATGNSRVFTEPDYKFALPKGTVIPRLVMVENGEERVLSGADEILNAFETVFALSTNVENDTKAKVISLLREGASYVASLIRIGRGMNVSPAAAASTGKVPRPEKPLVLYSYEGNQFCRLVREVLTELDIVYELRSAGKGSLRRDELSETSGGTKCPYMLDPNKDMAVAESADIIRYLYRNYALWTPPNELLQWTSNFVLPLVKPVFMVLAPLQAGSYKKEDREGYQARVSKAQGDIEAAVRSTPVVVYTYGLSPFSSETKALLDNLDISYTEISLGAEWFPGFIKEGGSETRVALLEMTGQSSLPHVFIGGESIGGLFSGSPGLIPLLEQNKLMGMVDDATTALK